MGGLQGVSQGHLRDWPSGTVWFGCCLDRSGDMGQGAELSDNVYLDFTW